MRWLCQVEQDLSLYITLLFLKLVIWFRCESRHLFFEDTADAMIFSSLWVPVTFLQPVARGWWQGDADDE